MKRLVFVLLAVVLFALPVAASAQQGKLLWDLSGEFSVDDLQLQFNYPKGWLYDTSSGITFAETKDDLTAQVDNDSATIPQGQTLSLIAYPFDQLGLPANPKVADVVAAVVKASGVTLDSQFDFSIMARHGVVITGTNSNGRAGAAVIWTQNNYAVIFGLSAPDMDTLNSLNYSFGYLLGSFRPLDPVELDDPVTLSGFPDYVIQLPKGWVAQQGDTGFQIFEAEEDSKRSADDNQLSGVVVTYVHQAASTLKVDASTLDALEKNVLDTLDKTQPYESEEYLLFDDQPAIRVRQASVGDTWEGVLFGLVNDEAYFFFIKAPTKDAFDKFEPTWIAMLSSITVPKSQ
jgi:hypothetical protein